MSCENEVTKRKSRKKLVYQKILQQMEFYFSPANLSKDRWLSHKLKNEEYVCLTEFLRFNKIKALTEDVTDLGKALRKSDVLTVTDDMKVKRSQPIRHKENEDDYVIYVEQVPPDADHDWIKEIFSQYGEIDYISIPRFKNSNKCKGFAFIEFSNVESAENVMEDFKSKGNYLSTDIAPAELLSIARYEGESESRKGSGEVECEIPQDATSRKRSLSPPLTTEAPDEKRLRQEDEEESQTEQDPTALEETSDTEESGKTKKKKNRKKNKKKKNKESSDNYGLQILTKRDWKRLRNKYLNMQKEKMKQLKKHLYLAQRKGDLSRPNHYHAEKKRRKDGGKEEEKAPKDIGEKEFVTGLIVRLLLDEPLIEVKNLKNQLKENTAIKYVDAKEGDIAVHLRFESTESASEFCGNSTWPNTKILKGQIEADYWEKLQKQRNKKLTAKVIKKGRGKEKLMKKAEHILGKHIIFDDI